MITKLSRSMAFIHWKNNVAILTMCAFFIVEVASNIKR